MEEEEDYLTCGKCMSEFRLDRITSFIEHKKQNCQESVETAATSNAELVCGSCPQGFMTAVGLLRHAQTIHKFKLFLQRSSGITGIQEVTVSQETDAAKRMIDQSMIHSIRQSLDRSLERDDQLENGSEGILLTSNQPHVMDLHQSERDISNLQLASNPCQIQTESLSRPSSSIMVKHSNVSKNNEINISNVRLPLLNLHTNPVQRLSLGNKQLSKTQFDSRKDISKSDISSIVNNQTSAPVVTSENNATTMTSPNENISSHTLSAIMKSGVLFPVLNKEFTSQSASDNQVNQQSIHAAENMNTQENSLALTDVHHRQVTEINQSSIESVDTSNQTNLLSVDTQVIKQPDVSFSMTTQTNGQTSSQVLTGVQIGNQRIESQQASPVLVSSLTDKQGTSPVLVADVNKHSESNNQDLEVYKEIAVNTLQSSDNIEPDIIQVSPSSTQILNSNESTGETSENTNIGCCDSQKCGVTVIPGTHEGLKKCCNAVVPKKRKRHFETKHTLSLRNKLMRRLSDSNTIRSCRSSDKKNSGTIFIDLEPNEDGTLSQKSNTSSDDMAFPAAVSGIGYEVSGLSRDSGSYLNRSKGKGSVILPPGAVFSIPISYSLSTQNDGSLRPLIISKHTFQTEASTVSQSTAYTANKLTETISNRFRMGTENVQAREGDMEKSVNSAAENDGSVNRLEIDLNHSEDGEQNPSRKRRYPTSRPFKCEKCDSAFNQRIHLKKHMSKHTGVKPFKCQQCSYSTVERSHLKVHIRIHTGEKPFKCTYCEYATAQNSTLKIHLKRHHKPSQGATNKSPTSV
ncbi:hunchback-like protein [Mytilus californianus]|uniref:hunchback-like protein n=1 Tax=Mytilus californianus TaxID=6549 RepID=UPI0022480319|nr:hunchback-like protein [Mytilus californianus]